MNIPPISIEQDGPGIDLTDVAAGISIEMSDPVTDQEYALNAVTMTFDLSGADTAVLSFEAMEYGDEPHAPPASPFGNGVNFDGVALSVDGVNWYEIQDLRSLRSDRFTAYDLDLVTIAAGLGLSLTDAFRIRFCQYDNNPAPKDGIFLKGILVSGDLRPAIVHLPMDDNAASAVVVDASAGGNDQTFLDPTGNPNTDAHSVAGVVGSALSFDGVDDRIDLGTLVDGALTAGHDFAVAFWWGRGVGNEEDCWKIVLKLTANGQLLVTSRFSAGLPYMQFYVTRSTAPLDQTLFTVNDIGYDWNHYVLQRRGENFELWLNGALAQEDSTVGNDRDFSGASGFSLGGAGTGFAKGMMDDFRVYDRALVASEIEALGATP